MPTRIPSYLVAVSLTTLMAITDAAGQSGWHLRIGIGDFSSLYGLLNEGWSVGDTSHLRFGFDSTRRVNVLRIDSVTALSISFRNTSYYWKRYMDVAFDNTDSLEITVGLAGGTGKIQFLRYSPQTASDHVSGDTVFVSLKDKAKRNDSGWFSLSRSLIRDFHISGRHEGWFFIRSLSVKGSGQIMPFSFYNRDPLEGYVSRQSVFPGEELRFYLSSNSGDTLLHYRILRFGGKEELKDFGGPLVQNQQPVPVYSHKKGCQWNSTLSYVVPLSFTSGTYLARFITGSKDSTDLLFVVKNPETASSRSKNILYMVATSTYQAYNCWGGYSYYSPSMEDTISFDRPYATLSGTSIDDETGTGQFRYFESYFVRWLETHYPGQVDYATNEDIDEHADMLLNHKLVIDAGHDEYWSVNVRNAFEAYIGQGGNVASFSSNTGYWRVKYSTDHRIMICHKSTGDAASDLWGEPRGLNRPLASLFGIQYTGPPTFGVPYVALIPNHWVFSGVFKNISDNFFGFAAGFPEGICGYEPDQSIANVSPTNLTVLAQANPPRVDGLGTLRGQMTIYNTPAGGMVFACGCNQWSWGLGDADGKVSGITANIVNRMISNADSAPALSNVQGRLFLPFSDANRTGTIFQYSVGTLSDVTLEVYDVLGRKLETLFEGIKPHGIYQTTWPSFGRPSGVYFVRLRSKAVNGSEGVAQTQRFVLVK